LINLFYSLKKKKKNKKKKLFPKLFLKRISKKRKDIVKKVKISVIESFTKMKTNKRKSFLSSCKKRKQKKSKN
jgi:hypothetical protein